ncbi:Transcription termination factor 5, mitochondrial [Anthophora retusa]
MFSLSFPNKFPMICRGKSVLYFCTHVHISNLLTKHLNLSPNGIKKLNTLEKDVCITKIPENQIIRSCKILQNMNVDLEQVEFLASCLKLQPIIIKNRIAILKEMGVKSISLKHIYRFPEAMRKSLKSFKIMYDIPVNEDIMQNLVQYLRMMTNKDYESPIEIKSTTRAGDFYEMCMLYYKTIYLNLRDPSFYKNRKLKYQSFTEMFKLINVLKTKCKFDDEFLKDHPYLLNLDADNIEEFLTELKSFNRNGKDIYDFIKKFPRTLFSEVSKAKELIELYNLLGIPPQALSSYATAFKMEKEVFLERYINIANRCDLSIWLQHRRVLSMVYYYKMVINRATYLTLLSNLYNPNIQTFLSNKIYFSRFTEGEIFYTAIKKHLLYILRKELGEDKTYVIDAIMRHPYWKHVSLVHIDRMLRCLKKYYSVDDICINVHIILYPRSKVVKVLNLLRQEYSLENGYKFTPAQYLALCLYKLEKKYHFSGDAVWQTMQTNMPNYNSNTFKDLSPNESDRFVEYIRSNDNIFFNVSEVAWLEYLLR